MRKLLKTFIDFLFLSKEPFPIIPWYPAKFMANKNGGFSGSVDYHVQIYIMCPLLRWIKDRNKVIILEQFGKENVRDLSRSASLEHFRYLIDFHFPLT